MPSKVLMGYDGSPAANAAIDVGAQLFPQARLWVAHLWTPPFASMSMRQRLWTGAGWDAEPLAVRIFGGEGLRFAELADKIDADLVLVGSRGLGGAPAVLGSVSDMVVHYTPRPVLVVPHPLLIAEFAALATGPVLVGYDGSAGAQQAVATAADLFPARQLLLTNVDDGEGPADGPDPLHVDEARMSRLSVPRAHGTSGRAVADALAGCARSRAAAAVVVGSRGRSAIREILLGSVAMATLHHAYLPVLVVPARA
jgi:nucleotide-binding universal stress UspA family protein